MLLFIVCSDLDIRPPEEIGCPECEPLIETPFYQIPIPALKCAHLDRDPLAESKLEVSLSKLVAIDPDIFTYFLALTTLHAQRRKYRAILDDQSIPGLQTIIPRGLLELGGLPADELASWLVWRKFIYDIDNRAAQTAGYLFEPILTASIGGVSYSASKSPVRREGKGNGRQVDCILDKDAYEFKMRVTIAASGKGRFAEELSFAEDCYLSDYHPVLLVLDPKPSAKLRDLSKEYRKYGGEAYVGDDAWTHLEEKAGRVMSQFLERYVRGPMSRIDESFDRLLPISLEYDDSNGAVHLVVGKREFVLR